MTTVAANSFNGWAPNALNTQLPPGDSLPLAANQQFGQGQILMFNASGDMDISRPQQHPSSVAKSAAHRQIILKERLTANPRCSASA